MTLAQVERSGVIEEIHDGAVAVVDPAGQLVARSGEIARPFFARSAAKPFQAYVAVTAGADLDPMHLAVACSSHSGDPVHVALVDEILSRAGLSRTALRCPPARPFPAADRRLASEGDVAPARIYHNCSGKHAAMLAACVASGWDPAGYLDPDHPLQQRIRSLMGDVSGVDPGPPGVDGCGAPVWQTTTSSLAQAFSRLANDPRFAGVRSVMGRYPALVSGEGRTDATIGRWLGTAAKGGAAGCIGVAAAGHGIAAKAWSGSAVVAGMGAVQALEHLGLVTSAIAAGLRPVAEPVVTGGAHEVGRIRPVAVLESV